MHVYGTMVRHVLHTMYFILQTCTCNDTQYTNDNIPITIGVIIVDTYMNGSIIASLYIVS